MDDTQIGYCVKCHGVISRGAPVCAHCGAVQSNQTTTYPEQSPRAADVAVTAIGAKSQSRFCTRCGQVIGNEAAFCSKCGAAQPRATVSESPSPTFVANSPQCRSRKPIAVKVILGVSGLFVLLILIADLAPESPQKNASAPTSPSEQADQPPAISELQRENERLE
jgi:RNA polymerase subunit RPABC4/transcription elongation factor Spt4